MCDNKINLKLKHDDDVRRVCVERGELNVKFLSQFSSSAFHLDNPRFSYRDDEGDVVSLDSDEELLFALTLFPSTFTLNVFSGAAHSSSSRSTDTGCCTYACTQQEQAEQPSATTQTPQASSSAPPQPEPQPQAQPQASGPYTTPYAAFLAQMAQDSQLVPNLFQTLSPLCGMFSQVASDPQVLSQALSQLQGGCAAAQSGGPASTSPLEQLSRAFQQLQTGEQQENNEKQPAASEDSDVHPAYCDCCQNVIQGPRFKCTTCDDFDLCGACEPKEGVHDPSHVFIKVKHPWQFRRRRFGCHARQNPPQSFGHFGVPHCDGPSQSTPPFDYASWLSALALQLNHDANQNNNSGAPNTSQSQQ